MGNISEKVKALRPMNTVTHLAVSGKSKSNAGMVYLQRKNCDPYLSASGVIEDSRFSRLDDIQIFDLYLFTFTSIRGILTFKRSRYVHLWIVVECLEVVFVGHLDISHPVKQILRPGVVDRKLNELANYRHVR